MLPLGHSGKIGQIQVSSSPAVASLKNAAGSRALLPSLGKGPAALDQPKSGASPASATLTSAVGKQTRRLGTSTSDSALHRTVRPRRLDALPALQSLHSRHARPSAGRRGSPQLTTTPPAASKASAAEPTRVVACRVADKGAEASGRGDSGDAVDQDSGALRYISDIAHSVSRDLDKVMKKCGELGEDCPGPEELSTLHKISSTAQQVCEELEHSDVGVAPARTQSDTPTVSYDDAALANARRIVALTNKLCEDLNNSCDNLGTVAHEPLDSEYLREVSATTQKVMEDLRMLQEQGWAADVLAASRAAGEPLCQLYDMDLPGPSLGAALECCTERTADVASVPFTKDLPLTSDGDGKCQGTGSRRGSQVQGLPDLDELLGEGGELDNLCEGRRARLQAAFRRFRVPGSDDVHMNDVSGLLQYLGHIIACKEKVLPLVKEVTSFEYLGFDEFMDFYQLFLPFEKQEFQRVFSEFDADKSGEICTAEVRDLLVDVGYIPLHASIQEALAVADKNDSGQLGFEELVAFLIAYRRAEGFSNEEAAKCRAIFDCFSKRGSAPGKLLPTEQLSDALVQVFGLYAGEFTKPLMERLQNGEGLHNTAYVSSQGGTVSEMLNFAEFLIFARKTREAIQKNMRGPFLSFAVKHGKTCSRISILATENSRIEGTITIISLIKVIKGMGYTPLKDNMTEVLQDVGCINCTDLDFSQFFDFILIYRQREGFKQDVVDRMQRVFDSFDQDKSGEINALELVELFRHLGHRLSLDDVHVFLRKVDENESNCLDFREYLRLMRLHREDELQRILKVFQHYANPRLSQRFSDVVIDVVMDGRSGHVDGTVVGLLPRNRLVTAIQDLQHTPPDLPPHVQSWDFDGFVAIIDACRWSLVAKERKKAGFNDARIEELKVAFQQYDKDGSGDIDNHELLSILTDFGWQPRTREEQAILIKKLNIAKQRAREAGIENRSNESEIDFWTFVQLSRMLETEREREEEAAVHQLMKELNFSQKEVDDFRAIFLRKMHELREAERDAPKEVDGKVVKLLGLPRDDILRLVRSLGISLLGQNKVKLDMELKKMGCTERQPLDFPGFLRLMSWLTTVDISGKKSAN